MKKITFGTPEKFVPSYFCKGFNYTETPMNFDTDCISFKTNSRGCVLTMPLTADEQIYGFGLQITSFNHKGKKLTLRSNADPVKPTGDTHAPVPFFVSTRGYGIYVDTARYAEFYCGAVSSIEETNQEYAIYDSTEDLYRPKNIKGSSVMAIQIPAVKGVDIYIIEGKNITETVMQYNMLSGGGCKVPEWGLGVFYRCHLKYTDEQVKKMADYFRDKDIPCDILGLEPGWQTHAYSCSFAWERDRYRDVEGMIDYLGKKGFHLSLWEHAFTHPSSPIYEQMKKGCADYMVWEGCVPDFALPEISDAFAEYHKNAIVKGCVDGFKLDECDGSDMTGSWSFPNLSEFPSGLDGEQYHNLFGVLYMQTILKALDGRPTLSEVRNAGALCASYPFVLYSDLYAHEDFIRACANSGFGGLLWAPELRHAQSKQDLLRRMQTVVFSAQCLINAWYCEEAPWLKFDCEAEVRELLKIRESLKPMLKAAFDEYNLTGKAPVRALVSDYSDDPETYNIDNEYIFCDMIVAPMMEKEEKRTVYLPKGEWRNYFTKEKAESGHFEYCGSMIPVYEKL